MAGAIRDAVNAFCGDVPQFDDMTLLVLKVT
jgi:serine phosphatase RsbU (regulator of sigma subunit)